MAGTRRLGVYTIRECKDRVDDYVFYFLNQLKGITDYLIVACETQIINTEDIEKLNNIADRVYAEEEKFTLTWEIVKGKEFKEIVVADSTAFGPFYPLETLILKISGEECDVLGLLEEEGNLASFFYVLKETMINSESMEKLCRCIDGSGLSMKKMEEEGICCQTSVDDKLRDYPCYYVEKEKYPFLPIAYFQEPYGDILDRHSGEAIPRTMKYLKEKTEYNTEMIWKHWLKISNQADIKKIMQCNYVLSSKIKKNGTQKQNLRVALILHIYYEELAPFCRKYAESMPEGTDVYVTVPTEEKMQTVKRAFADFPFHTEFRIVGNIGRDVGPFIVGCKDVVFNYDLVCKMHDKKVYQVQPMSVGESWAYKCFENMLKNKVFVENVITTFEENPSLGMLTPPVPMHGPYYPTVGFGEWSTNYGIVKQLASDLGLTVPMEESKEPVAPLGSMFWFRPEALKCLFAPDWTYDDLPKEPIAPDATILHGIERIYPFCMQQEGYYSGWVMVDTFARIEINNWRYLNGELQRAERKKVKAASHKQLLEQIRSL